VLRTCHNEKVTDGIIRYLLNVFPAAAIATDENKGCTPLHYACYNKNITLGSYYVVRLGVHEFIELDVVSKYKVEVSSNPVWSDR
jgi:hypothetical protein